MIIDLVTVWELHEQGWKQKDIAAAPKWWLKHLTWLETCGILRELSKTRQSLIPTDQAPVSFHAPVPR
ncbi:hypothetical protein ccbrp13_45770 [Ktedonobacteria bacterium brp13]|nr:hypothetical protein ccbrp13_45770 [Ktedonobacteria bacterium brp13]